MFSLIRHFLGLAALIGFLTPALAAGDPPGRVGRLSQVDGDVTFRADRQDPGGPAAINWPISSGAIIDTERRSRAEVWVGSTAYRLAGNSRAEFVTVDDQIVDLIAGQRHPGGDHPRPQPGRRSADQHAGRTCPLSRPRPLPDRGKARPHDRCRTVG